MRFHRLAVTAGNPSCQLAVCRLWCACACCGCAEAQCVWRHEPQSAIRFSRFRCCLAECIGRSLSRTGSSQRSGIVARRKVGPHSRRQGPYWLRTGHYSRLQTVHHVIDTHPPKTFSYQLNRSKRATQLEGWRAWNAALHVLTLESSMCRKVHADGAREPAAADGARLCVATASIPAFHAC